MLIVERVLEAVVLFVAVRTGAHLLGIPWGDGRGRELGEDLRRRALPVAAIAMTSVLVVGFVTCLVWSGALHALSRPGAAETGWQVFTAPFVQEGVVGGIYNVITAFVVLALAEWAWGSVTATVIWLFAAWAPVGDVARAVGYHVSHADLTAYSAGSSGATYFTMATLCAVLVVVRADRTRWSGLAVAAVGLVMWMATNDGHGVLVVEGFVAGALLSGLCVLGRGSRLACAGCGSVATGALR